MSNTPINVLIWDENPPHTNKEIYPKNIRGAIADGLRELGGDQVEVVEAHIDEEHQGLSEERLAKADVLLWWAHMRHADVDDAKVESIKNHVHHRGMGFMPLHSGHHSKPFKVVLGASGDLKGGYRDHIPGEPEEITVAAPKHPIAEGISDFVIDEEEMYGAPFGSPPPHVVVFQSYFPKGGEYFPSIALTVGDGIDPDFTCGWGNGHNQGEGKGRVFYLRPGHEQFGTYYNPIIKKIMWNAVRWTTRRS